MSKYKLHRIWHLLDEEMGMKCKAGFQEHPIILCDLWNFTATLGLRVSKQSASEAWVHPRRRSKGSAIASGEELSYTKGEVWLNHNFSDSRQGFPKFRAALSEEDGTDPEPPGTHSYFHNPLHLNGNDKRKKQEGRADKAGSPECVLRCPVRASLRRQA